MSSTSPHIRPATQHDIGAIVELVNRAYRDTREPGWTSEAEIVAGERAHPHDIEALLSPPESMMLALSLEQRVCGCVHIRAQQDGAYIGMLSIEPRMQNHGLGKRLLQAAEQYALEHMGADQVSMIVVGQRTELIDYYQRRGYRLNGETAPYPVGLNVGSPRVEGLYMVTLVKPLLAEQAG